MPQGLADYDRIRKRIAGQIQGDGARSISSLLNPLRGSSFTITTAVGTNAAGQLHKYAFSDGTDTWYVSYTTVGVDEDKALFSAGFLASANAQPEFLNAFAVSDDGAGIFTAVAKSGFRSYTIGEVADPSGRVTPAAAADSNVDIPVARMVVYGTPITDPSGSGSRKTMALPTNASVAKDIAGFVVIGTDTQTLDVETRDVDKKLAVFPGFNGNVMRQGEATAESETAVTQGGDVYLRKNGTGDKGILRADSDGGNAILVPGCRWAETVPLAVAGTLVLADIEINIP